MRIPIFFFTIGFFSAVALIVSVLLFIWGTNNRKYEIHMSAPSPDRKHIAAVYTGMGGGAAGWCSSYVSVSTEDEKEKLKEGKSDYDTVVFDGSCSTDPTVQWETDRKLIIKYNGPKNRGSIRVYKCPLSKDDKVQIVFVEV